MVKSLSLTCDYSSMFINNSFQEILPTPMGKLPKPMLLSPVISSRDKYSNRI